MIYYYDIFIEYEIGNQKIIKQYTKDFIEIVDFMIWLKQKHKSNFKIIRIKEHRSYGRIKL